MKGDFSRRTFRAENHYRSVLLQQGRVQLDADFNEQADIRDHLHRVTARDTFGPHGAPTDTAGMAIVVENDIPIVTAGRYYVDGVLCENDAPVPLFDQPDLPGVPPPGENRRYVAYLDVWTEHVTAAERPELREVALGGPDTATRARTIWQVRIAPGAPEATCAALESWRPDGARTTATLRARAHVPPEGATDPCVVPVSAGYRRLENQLYRVEIHDGSGGEGPATFVWSRENGSVVARLVSIDGDTLTTDAPGRDERLGFATNQWVEVIGTDRIRRGEPGFLGRLASAVDTTLTVAEWVGGNAPTSEQLTEPAVVRRWDSAGASPVAEGWTDLEDGVQVSFDSATATFRTGDYWLIPARSANLSDDRSDPDLAGDVEWPRDTDGEPLPRPPDGVEHRYAPVALLDLGGGDWTVVSDCRRLFPPLTGLAVAAYAGGDGQETVPGEPLPRPLEVSVTGPLTPPAVAMVRFTIGAAGPPGGGLARSFTEVGTSTAQSVDASTGTDGVARVYWRPAATVTRPSQQVTAWLLDRDGDPTGAPIHFNADLSVAERVWLDPAGCPALAGANDVQAAIHQLANARSLVAVGGDGQDARPEAVLPQPVTVAVRTDCGPVTGATVRCTVSSGAVAADPADLDGDGSGQLTIDLDTDAFGLAACYWRLGDTPADGTLVQVLTAELRPDAARVDVPPLTVEFTANLDVSPQVRPGLRVTGVELVANDAAVPDGSEVEVEQLIDGIRVTLDGPPDPGMVDESVLTLTLELPYPISGSDRTLWFADGEAVVFGTVPLTVSGAVSQPEGDGDPGSALLWQPTGASRPFILDRLFPTLTENGGGDRVRARLRLAGGTARGSSDEVQLRAADDVRGFGFTRWFWLVPETTTLVVVPRRGELFRLKTVRDALALTTPRDELRAALPGVVRISSGPQPDLAAAGRAVARGFRGGAERRLVLIADERYADAAAVIRDAFAQVDVVVEVIGAADPAHEARNRVEAGDRFDGVLTDAATAPRFAELGGFSAAIPL